MFLCAYSKTSKNKGLTESEIYGLDCMMTARTAIIITKVDQLACQKYGYVNGPILFYFRLGLARSLISSRYHFAHEKVLTHIHDSQGHGQSV